MDITLFIPPNTPFFTTSRKLLFVASMAFVVYMIFLTEDECLYSGRICLSKRSAMYSAAIWFRGCHFAKKVSKAASADASSAEEYSGFRSRHHSARSVVLTYSQEFLIK